MRIVKFNDGTFGIRKLTIAGFEFYDFRSSRPNWEYWWTTGFPGANYLYDGSCRTTEENAKHVFCMLNKQKIKDIGTSIKHMCKE